MAERSEIEPYHKKIGVICSAMVARVVPTISTTKRKFKKFNEISKIPKMSVFYRKKSDIRLPKIQKLS